MPTEGQSGQKLMQNINFLKVMPKYTVKTAEFGQKHQMNDSQNEREVTNLHRKCKNQKNEENQSLRNSYKKKLIFFKMQNFTPFWRFVTSRFINGFFRKNSHPPI